MFPRKFVYLISLISIFLLCIPIYYGVTYANNRVDILTDEITKIEEKIEAFKNDPSNNEEYTLEKMNHKNFSDFDITLKATKFDLEESNNGADYEVAIANENMPGGKIVGDVEFKIALGANWIKFYRVSGTARIDSKYLYQESNYNKTSLHLSDLNSLTQRTNYFIPFPKPTAYLLVSYTFQKDGSTKKLHKNVILDYQYGDYSVISGGYPA